MQPLLPGHALSIGVTSYDGGVYFGLNGDRDALPDLDVLGQCVTEALEELVDSVSPSRQRAPRGRKKTTEEAGDAREHPRLRPQHPRAVLRGHRRRPTASARRRSSRTPSPTACARRYAEGGEEEWEYAASTAAAAVLAGAARTRTTRRAGSWSRSTSDVRPPGGP